MTPTAAFALLAVLASTAAAGAASPPKRAPGLWETTTITNAGRSGARECIDAATDRLVRQAMAGQSCRNDDFRDTPEGYVAGAICKAGGMMVDNKIVVTGDFATWARAEATSTLSGLDGGGRRFSTTIDARRLGDCAPAQKPGDVILPNGTVINVGPAR